VCWMLRTVLRRPTFSCINSRSFTTSPSAPRRSCNCFASCTAVLGSACLSSVCRKTKHHPLILLRKHNANLMWCGYGQRTVQLPAFFKSPQTVHPLKTDNFSVNLKFSVQRSNYWTNELTDYVTNIYVVIYP
jgi:hypothetical protein